MKRDNPSHTVAQAPIRRRPRQARSLARVERILAAATALIAERGSEQVTMSELAARADVTMASLYQYFPDKRAIIRQLAGTALERIHQGLAEALADIASPAEAMARLDTMLDGYYALFRSEPVMRDIWCGAQGDRDLQAQDLADSRRNGALAFAALRRFVPPADAARFATSCFLLMQLTGAAVRMAIAVERDEGDRLIEAYRTIIRASLASFLTAAPVRGRAGQARAVSAETT